MSATASFTPPIPVRAELLAPTGDSARPPLTKIIATVGPASGSPEVVSKLIGAGVGAFRINFGHGDSATHEQALTAIRAAADLSGRAIAVMGDLQGPKIRLGAVPEEGIEVRVGSTIIFDRGSRPARATPDGARLSATYPRLIDDVRAGDRVLINDGRVRLLAIAKRTDELECAVTVGGLLTTGKGVNLPDSMLGASAISEEDWKHVDWAIRHDLDFLALSFVGRAAEIRELREGMERIKVGAGRTTLRMPIIAKIERPAALECIDEIVDAADGIMVARGDLGVEMDLARVPVVQKQLLAAVHAFGKPCIIATQMLESMMNSPSPTRAEASDVAGAIFDCADAVMLSGETAVGKFPVLAVETMARIARQTESYLAAQPPHARPPQKLVESRYRTAALAHGVWTVAQDIAAKFIVVWSQQGGGARYLSQNDFCIPIIAASTDERALRQMQLLRGVTPVRMPLPEGLAHFTRMVDQYLLETAWARPGDPCILVAGGPIGRQGVTNSLAIHVIGDPDTGFARHTN